MRASLPILFNRLSEVVLSIKSDYDGWHMMIKRCTRRQELPPKPFSHLACNLPAWVNEVISARPENENQQSACAALITVPDAEVYEDKCDSIVRGYLSRIVALRTRDNGHLNGAIEDRTTEAEGSFLYLHYVRIRLVHGNDVYALPIGLAGVHWEELNRALGPAVSATNVTRLVASLRLLSRRNSWG